MFALGLPFLALLVASVESHLGVLGPKNVSQKDAEFERTYVDEVNSELVNIYTFNHTVTRNRVREGAGLRAGGEWGEPDDQGSVSSQEQRPLWVFQNHTGPSCQQFLPVLGMFVLKLHLDGFLKLPRSPLLFLITSFPSAVV